MHVVLRPVLVMRRRVILIGVVIVMIVRVLIIKVGMLILVWCMKVPLTVLFGGRRCGRHERTMIRRGRGKGLKAKVVARVVHGSCGIFQSCEYTSRVWSMSDPPIFGAWPNEV